MASFVQHLTSSLLSLTSSSRKELNNFWCSDVSKFGHDMFSASGQSVTSSGTSVLCQQTTNQIIWILTGHKTKNVTWAHESRFLENSDVNSHLFPSQGMICHPAVPSSFMPLHQCFQFEFVASRERYWVDDGAFGWGGDQTGAGGSSATHLIGEPVHV